MEAQKVDMFIISNGRYFDQYQILQIREQLLAIDDNRWPKIASLRFDEPNTILLASIFAGGFGVDRFLIGDMGLGFGKLITLGGCGIWAVIDWFLIRDATRQRNLEKLQQVMGRPF